MRCHHLRLLVSVIAMAAGLATCRQPTPSSGPPNVLLISIDSLRADRLRCYGSSRATSPTMDRLAAEGVRFARAYSPTSWTLPAHATLLTGLAQHHHGVLRMHDVLRTEQPVLAEIFGRHAFETAGFYSGPFLHSAYGFDRGFERYVSCQSADVRTTPGASSALEALTRSHGDQTNECLREAFGAWARQAGTRPFFAFVHMWDVHYDYIPPAAYVERFDPNYRGALDGRNIFGEGFPLSASPRDVAHLLARYDAEIRYTDETIQTMVEALDERGLLRNTLIVVTADHGEEFLEHRGKGHQQTLYAEVVRVPLLLWGPGAPAGQVVSAPVALEDVAPTILELAGIDGLDAADGRSLVPLLRGESVEPRPVLSMRYLPSGRLLRFMEATLRDGTTTVHYQAVGRTWLAYDALGDPGEQLPLPALDSPLRRRLNALVTEAREALAALAAQPKPATATGRTTPEGLPDKLVDQLRSLGYVD